jgi:hypothetical protein
MEREPKMPECGGFSLEMLYSLGQNPSVMHSGRETLKCEPLKKGT